MMQAAIFAMQAIDNGTVPDTAPALFQAGFFMGFNNADVRDLLTECWVADQHMADSCDAFIAAIEKKDWATVTSTIKQFTPEVLTDVQPCKDDAKYQPVMDQYDNQEHILRAAKADPDWQIKALRAILPHKADVKSYVADAEAKWDAGDYYNAGVSMGKIEGIALAPWMSAYTIEEYTESMQDFLQ